MAHQNAKIIIIGAGISGIAAASKLVECGFKNVTLLEAEKKIGGRVNTVEFASNRVDLGAQWCHGEKDNVIYELVKTHKVLDKTTISYPNVNFFSSSGQIIDKEKCERLMALCLSILHESKPDLMNYKGSLGSYILSKYQEALRTKEFEDIDSEISHQLLEYFQKYENSIEASDTWFDTSGNGYLSYWECEGHPLLNWKDKGYATVIDYITKKKPDVSKALNIEEKVIFDKEVTHIDWSNDRSMTIKCSDGESFLADHIITTVSLGVLKENYKTLFSPPLPKLKINAIEGLSIGTVDKIFLEFEKPFWEKDWAGFSLLWSRKDCDAIRGTRDSWLEDVFGFYKVDYQPNILCGWIGGPSARIMENLDDETVMNGCLLLFDKFLGNRMNWKKPVRILRSKWYSNKHFRGSYSFRSVTTDLLRTSANDLALPLYDSLGRPVILWGGEATSEHYYSTVHGACEAGWREAKRLVDFYSRQTTENLKSNSSLLSKPANYDVIVLGSGISGLGATTVLKKSGKSFVVLEAQGYAGGRIKTVEMKTLRRCNGNRVRCEAGAQWIHGRDNEFYRIAEDLKLIRPELSEEAEGDYVCEDGERLDDFFVKKIDFRFGKILEECEQFVGRKSADDFEFPSSLGSFVDEKFEKCLDELETRDEKEKALQLLDWHKRFQIIDNSCSNFNDISAKTWGNYSFNGESCQTHINVYKGMSAISDELYESVKENVKLNHVVDLIYWKSEDYATGSNRILVQCENGSLFQTNNLICTFSLGFLKQQHFKVFCPPLPEAHQKVIDTIGFGTINKIFLNFESKWWSDDWKGLQLIFKDSLNDNSHWTRFISGLDVVYPEPKNSLIGWIGGKGAIDMENLQDEEIANECMKIIRRFLRRTDIPDPSNFYCSRWNSNEFVKGAYSFTSKYSDKILHWEKELSKPIVFKLPHQAKANTILLAGEACHGQFFSTIHGAFLSGIEQAKAILRTMSDNSKISAKETSCQSKL